MLRDASHINVITLIFYNKFNLAIAVFNMTQSLFEYSIQLSSIILFIDRFS